MAEQAPLTAAPLAEVVLHLGAHATDAGRFARWLDLNRETLADLGTGVVDPPHFARTISHALAEQGGAGSLAQETALLARLSPGASRLVVSAPGLLGPVSQVVAPQGFYRRDVARRLHGLRVLFHRCKLTLLLAIREPRHILPALLARSEAPDIQTALGWVDDETLPWAGLVANMRRHVPGADIVVWRHETLPDLWPEVLDCLAGAPAPTRGLLETMPLALSAEAVHRLRGYLARTPPESAAQLARVVRAFGRRYGAGAWSTPPRGPGEPARVRSHVGSAGGGAFVPAAGDLSLADGPFGTSANASASAVTVGEGPDLPDWLGPRLGAMSSGYATEWDDIANMSGVRALGGPVLR